MVTQQKEEQLPLHCMIPSGAWNFQCSEEATASCLEKSGKFSVRNKKSCMLIKGKEKEGCPSSNEQYGHIS